MKHRILRADVLAGAVILAAAAAAATLFAADPIPSKVEIRTLSTDASRVTGGNVLVQINVPPTAIQRDVAKSGVKVTVGNRDVTAAFQSTSATSLVGLVTSLIIGKNTLAVSAGRSGSASLEITNYPITGPVTSGPWQQPFICQTDVFTLPDG